MKTVIVIRDNVEEKGVRVPADLTRSERELMARIGEQVAQRTDWDITVVAVNSK